MTLEYRVLGPLDVVKDGQLIDLGPHRQRAVLALLFTHRNSVVSTDTILDELWGSDAATDKQNVLWVYISGLRNALEPERAKRSSGTALLTRSPGYVLRVEDSSSDNGIFEKKLREARSTIDADPAAAGLLLREAMELWRGHPFEEFMYEPWASNEIRRLEALRLEALELRVEADLRHGADRQLIPELEALCRLNPFRERLVGSLMLALHRAGRTADALRTFKKHRDQIGSELGIEPAIYLQDLEQRILIDDPTLWTPTGRADLQSPTGLSVRGYELRNRIGAGPIGEVYRAFHPAVGREVAVKVIRPSLANRPVFIRQFESEGRVIAALEHSNIVPLYDYWREPNTAYLVMRLMRGGSLEDVLAETAITPDRAAILFGQLFEALAAAHQRGVIHGDIKPSNVLLDQDGNAYISDFGIAIDDAPELHGSNLSTIEASRIEASTPDEWSDVCSLALVVAQALAGTVGDFEEIRGALPPAVVDVLDRATSSDPNLGPDGTKAFAVEFLASLGQLAPTTEVPERAVTNPYKGLRPFSPLDAPDFFGRDRLITRLLARLGAEGPTNRFVALVGPSGSGKSSVVRAGVIPALATGAVPGSGSWFVIQMKPGDQPFESLETALMSVAIKPPPSFLEVLMGEDGFRRAIKSATPDGVRLLLVIDQFEELYTLPDETIRERFVDSLVSLVEGRDAGCQVLVTLRADFFDRPLAHRGLGELIRTGTEAITPMSSDELEAAITRPADSRGVSFDSGVVRSLLHETIDRPGALPLLQYALTELFDRRNGRTVSTSVYDASGGVSAALVRRADSILTGLTPAAQGTVREVLLRLVAVGEDGAEDTSRRALISELTGLGSASDVGAVLEVMGRHRLVSFDRDPVSRGPTVEISHETLLKEWGTFRGWIEEARSDLLAHRRLAAAIREWDQAGQNPAYLLSEGRLEQTLAWTETTSVKLTQAETDYLERSIAERESRQTIESDRQRRTVEAIARARRRTRQLSIVGGLALGLMALAWFSLDQRQEARRAEQRLAAVQTSARLAVASGSNLAGDPELAVLLALESVKSTAHLAFATPEAVDAVHWALQELGVTYPVTDSTPRYVRRGPSGAAGVWGLPVDQLTRFAEESVGERRLTPAECSRFDLPSCPSQAETSGLEILGGIDMYAGVASPDQIEVVVLSPLLYTDRERMQENLDEVAAELGISIRLDQERETTLEDIEDRPLGSIYMTAAPGSLPDILRHHGLVDVGSFLGAEELEAAFGEYLVSLARLRPAARSGVDEGPIYGIPVKADAKSLVWTRRSDFRDLGYAVPDSWEAFEVLLASIQQDGFSPLCLGFNDSVAPGWPATDLVENVLLLSEGTALYDAWAAHEIPFDDPRIVAAIRRIGHLVLTEGNTEGGPKGALVKEFWEAGVDLWEGEEASCLLSPSAHFLPGTVLDDGRSDDAQAFPFPPINPEYRAAMVGGAMYAIALADRPEVRDIMRVLASSRWGLAATRFSTPSLLPAHAEFDVGSMADDEFKKITSSIQAAIRAGQYRFDASDLMPPEIQDSFYQGILRLIEEGTPETVDDLSGEVASEIEAIWSQLEAQPAAATTSARLG